MMCRRSPTGSMGDATCPLGCLSRGLGPRSGPAGPGLQVGSGGRATRPEGVSVGRTAGCVAAEEALAETGWPRGPARWERYELKGRRLPPLPVPPPGAVRVYVRHLPTIDSRGRAARKWDIPPREPRPVAARPVLTDRDTRPGRVETRALSRSDQHGRAGANGHSVGRVSMPTIALSMEAVPLEAMAGRRPVCGAPVPARAAARRP